MQKLFDGIFDSTGAGSIGLPNFMLCVGFAVLCGIILALCYMYRTKHSRGFVATLAILPAVVAVVILMVNGNLGAGVAVAGAFSLVRFRSAPGTAKEIGAIFIAMGVGLVIGMGYLGYAVLVSVLFGGLSLLYNVLGCKIKGKSERYKVLRITIPEDLDYTDVFDELLADYAVEYELTQVKTTNMGSLFRLTYTIVFKKNANEREMINKLRCRNGNLEVAISKQDTTIMEL